MSFLDKVLQTYNAINNQLPAPRNIPNSVLTNVFGEALSGPRGLYTDINNLLPGGPNHPISHSSVVPQVVAEGLQGPLSFYNAFRTFGNHGNVPLPTWPQTINNPLLAREQQRVAAQTSSEAANTSNGSKTSGTSPDAHTDSAWYNDPHYAVVSQLSRDEYVKPFASADGYKIIRSTTKIVLDKLKNKGYTITPDMYQQLEAAAIPASKVWVNQRKAAGQDRSSIEYYLMLTDLALSHVVQTSPSTPDTASSITPPQTNVPLNPDQTAPAQQEGSTVHMVTPSPDPTTGKVYGTGDIHMISGVNKTGTPESFDKWAAKNQDLWDSSPDPAGYEVAMKNIYLEWVDGVRRGYTQADVSPEAWEEFNGYKAWNADHRGGS